MIEVDVTAHGPAAANPFNLDLHVLFSARPSPINSNVACIICPSLTSNMSSFIPRTAFPALDSLPRSYYLGHHAAGLSRIRTMLSQINLVIECRDARIPLTSRNPMFENNLVGKERVIVYTKKDLALQDHAHVEEQKVGRRLIYSVHHLLF